MLQAPKDLPLGTIVTLTNGAAKALSLASLPSPINPYRVVESVLGEDKIYGSNTSTIPISLLAKSSKRPQNFIGIHFFSP